MSSRYSAAAGAHQRDLRTQLFSSSPKPPSRTSSPYDPLPSESDKHQQAYMLHLESQNNEEMDNMSQKVAMLKTLGLKMGTEINKSIKLNDEITNSFEKGKTTLKNTYNKMVVMSQRAGITWRMWLVVLLVVVLFFTYAWLF
jgi:blocked-early-in-transport protein 1